MAVDHIGREIEVESLGKKWKFSRWNREVWVKLAAWAKTELPDPLEAATRNIDKAILKDAEIIRELRRRDDAEYLAATAEGRKPILLAPDYKQMSEQIIELATTKAVSYLSFNSPEMTSLMRSTVGCSYCLWLLLLKHHPDVTLDDAYEIFMDLSQRAGDEIDKIVTVTQGRAESKPKNG